MILKSKGPGAGFKSIRQGFYRARESLKWEFRWAMAWLLLGVVGIGSALFHATLRQGTHTSTRQAPPPGRCLTAHIAAYALLITFEPPSSYVEQSERHDHVDMNAVERSLNVRAL